MSLHKSCYCALLLACAALLMASCATEPVTGRPQPMLSTREQERLQSEEAWMRKRTRLELCDNKALQAILERVGQRLVSATDNAGGYDWEFVLFKGTSINAFSLPNGKVGVYEGVFLCVRNEAELATIVSHEIAHVVARHGGERYSEKVSVELGRAVLSTALQYSNADNADAWLAAYTGLTDIGVIYPFSRLHENTADRIGLLAMAQAGYDPGAALAFWERFASMQAPQKNVCPLMAAHPSDKQRMSLLGQYLPEAQSLYRVSEKHGLGATFSIAK